MAEHIRHRAPGYWQQLAGWLRHEPEEERARLAAALESADEADYYSAAFELYLTQYLASRGWEFTRHPTLGWTSKQPDYLVHHPKGDFLLEAAVVLESDDARRAERVRNELRDALDAVTGPFDVIMTIDGRYSGQHSASAVAEWLRDQLAALALAEGEWRDLVYEAEGFRITFTTLASESNDSPVVVIENLTGSIAADVTTHSVIKDSLDAKQSDTVDRRCRTSWPSAFIRSSRWRLSH